MKKAIAIILTLALALVLVACAPKEKTSDEEKKLVIYTSSTEEMQQAVGTAFEEATGIKIEFVIASTGESIARLVAEKDNPQCDVFLGGAADVYVDTQYWAPYISVHNDELPEAYRTTDGYCNATNTSTPVILYNTDLVKDEIKGYADLLRPELKGQIAFGDAAKSNSAYNHLENMLLAMGKGDAYSKEAWDYVEALLKNLDGIIVNSSSVTHKGVVSGEYAVGLTWDTPCGTYIAEGIDNVKVCLMEEGIAPKLAAAAIVKNCPHPTNAQIYVDFITSKEGQEVLASVPGYAVVRTDITLPEGYVDLGINKANLIKLDYAWCSSEQENIRAKYQQLYVSIFE